jgi:hypothetical protein
MRARLIKIGVAGDIRQRERQLRAEHYGGFADWVVLINVWVKKESGQIERQISSRIKGKRVYGGYWKDGFEKIAIEMIRSPFSAALEPFAEALGLLFEQRYLDQWPQYEFVSASQL